MDSGNYTSLFKINNQIEDLNPDDFIGLKSCMMTMCNVMKKLVVENNELKSRLHTCEASIDTLKDGAGNGVRGKLQKEFQKTFTLPEETEHLTFKKEDMISKISSCHIVPDGMSNELVVSTDASKHKDGAKCCCCKNADTLKNEVKNVMDKLDSIKNFDTQLEKITKKLEALFGQLDRNGRDSAVMKDSNVEKSSKNTVAADKCMNKRVSNIVPLSEHLSDKVVSQSDAVNLKSNKKSLPTNGCNEKNLSNCGMISELSRRIGSRLVDPRNIISIICDVVSVQDKKIKGDRKADKAARCSVVDYYQNILFDSYILPDKPIVDYKTITSGIQPCHMKDAIPFKNARITLMEIMKGKILVGYNLVSDLQSLNLSWPRMARRDIRQCIWLYKKVGVTTMENPIELETFAYAMVATNVQAGESQSVHKALIAMSLYKLVSQEWEKEFEEIEN